MAMTEFLLVIILTLRASFVDSTDGCIEQEMKVKILPKNNLGLEKLFDTFILNLLLILKTPKNVDKPVMNYDAD